MGFLDTLKSFGSNVRNYVSTGLGKIGGAISNIASSNIINKLGSFASTAAPYVGAGLETFGRISGSPMISLAGMVAKEGLSYLGNEITNDSQHYNDKLNEYGGNLTTFGKFVGPKKDND